MFKGISNLAALIKQAHQISSHMDQITEAMKNHRVTGSSGGGMVEIEVNGLMEVSALPHRSRNCWRKATVNCSKTW